ncbi:N-acetyl-beta-D-galactosaminidase [Aureococcus anophagefferens]|uniref:beta-N-acetylhexosaminidase n=1 Tax=Aureococcus anophagefferens TaxID=44056 RepID=A0ABR1GAB9_AURAN
MLRLLPLLATAAAVWPAPKSISLSGASVKVQPGGAAFFKLNGTSPLLEAAFERYAGLVFPHRAASDGAALASLAVRVADVAERAPQLGDDESYALSIGATAATLEAATVWGALRGLETFSQLVSFDFDAGSYEAAAGAVEDAPRFPHRGLMIDTGRHFQPLASIFEVVDALPYAKINVLHWHVVDAQSFPFESTSMPELWRGAFSPRERYTQADVADVVERARLRGVRVIPEFDMPGHADSWCVGRPDLCPSETCASPLDVSKAATFDAISGLLDELAGGLFPDGFVHLGGDEVNTACWESTPSVAAWLKARNLTADGGYAHFVKTVADLAIAKKRRPVQWSEVWDHFKTDLPKDVVVHVWKSVTNVADVVAAGYDVIRNVGYDATSWYQTRSRTSFERRLSRLYRYLDNLNVNSSAVYGNEPCDGIPADLCAAHVLGGHGEM